ncbi:ATP-binding protein [Shewanella sp. Isolate7]|uniref:ATP-binding protein n=1 Tax=Shewanella sp. Isolate7 TaxID=2908528 RepID=UPI001EFD51BD|nr:ATP-binding protein [Shewanella sp. Isolate7]MCG9721176.1 ATP-binding protein [Shewanella sp. Isolate7]
MHQRHLFLRIRVGLYQDKIGITFIADDGPGFEGKGKQLLAAFARDKEQADDSGYGLGLYIARKIAIWHQGRLEVARSSQLGGASLTLIWRNQQA